MVEHSRGGAKGGSSTIVWYLTEAGERLLRLADHDKSERRARVVDPSKRFIRHTLAVAECSMQIREICARHDGLTLEALELEPACWRPYTHIGKVVSLKPDLYAQNLCGEYEDRWFIEVDLATESSPPSSTSAAATMSITARAGAGGVWGIPAHGVDRPQQRPPGTH